MIKNIYNIGDSEMVRIEIYNENGGGKYRDVSPFDVSGGGNRIFGEHFYTNKELRKLKLEAIESR